jgi:allophanate hydrolase subunit 2
MGVQYSHRNKEQTMMTGHMQMSLDEWKAKCQVSFHVRNGDVLVFSEPNRYGVIACMIENTSVYLGSYFIENGQGYKAGTGWLHA